MSGMTDFDNYLQAQTAEVGATPANTQAAAHQAARVRRLTSWINSGEAAGAAYTAMLGYVPVAGTVTACRIVPDANLAADAADFNLYELTRDDGAGGGATVIASRNTKAGEGGAWTAGQAVSLTLSSTIANRSWTAASALKLVKTPGGGGKATPKCCVIIEYTED